MDTVSDNRSEIATFKSFSSGDIYDQIDRVYFHNFNSNHESPTKFDTASFSSGSTSSFNDSELAECSSIVEYELKRLHSNAKSDYKNDIKLKIKQLQTQANLVSCRISDNILQNSQAYSQELQRVSDFKLLLEDSFQICSIARQSLFMNETFYTRPTLMLIKKQACKSNLIKMYKSVEGLKQLKLTNVKIKELIAKADYPSAIRNCFECEKALVIYEHFKCIKELKKHVKDHFYQIERLLDVHVGKVCQDFEEEVYEMIVTSYQLLDKHELFIGNLI